MNDYKNQILDNICYTELVYERINKKLHIKLSKDKIEEMISEIIRETDNTEFRKTGKKMMELDSHIDLMYFMKQETRNMQNMKKITT